MRSARRVRIERGADPRQLVAEEATESASVAILAPIGRDGAVAEMVLSRAGFATVRCAGMSEVCAHVRNDAGVLLLAEEALLGSGREELLAALEGQEAWSDIPVIVLTAEGELTQLLSPMLDWVVNRANVTLLERPVRVATLVSALRSALRARRRQFDVRDHLVERLAAERELRAAREEAEHASRAKGEFLAVMSHELRTPLNAIGGYAELMELGLRGPVTDEQRLDLARIQQSQRHLLGLINQVLNYTRVETGTVTYSVTRISAAEALQAAEALILPQVNAKGITCTFDVPDPGLALCGDREKVQQILLNLLTNAIKFTDAGGRIVVSAASADPFVAITIRDTGVGIADNKLSAIFEPFVQVNSGLTRTHEGVGLGLAISRDLARGMGGDLRAQSRAGSGSTFTLTMPAA